jgi:hypothetical protein
VASPRIAILTSTTALRKTSSRNGISQQRMNVEAALKLSEEFDVVIVGSTAADEVFEYLGSHLPRQSRQKFRFYSRSYFKTQKPLFPGDDGRNSGWQNILLENQIPFEQEVDDQERRDTVTFNWRAIDKFVRSNRVTFVTGAEGQMIYTRAKG